MAQFSKGDTFVDGQQVTGARLNQLVDAAQALVGLIADQPSVTAGTLETTDSILINDGGVLKKATVSDILNSGLAVTTPSITSSANNDVTLTPNDGISVVGSNYVSADGLTVTVTTLSAHGLAVNNVVEISGAGSGYNGTHRITYVTSLTFQYVMYVAATPTGSPTACTYVRKANALVNGNEVVSQNLFVANKTNTQNIDVSGTANFRTANVTTAMQFSGVPVFGLASIDEYTIPYNQADATTEAQRISTCNQWRVVTSLTSQTKTDKEIWVIEADFPLVYWPWAGAAKFSIHRLGTATNLSLEASYIQNNGSAYVSFDTKQIKMKCVIPSGVTFTSETIQFRFRYNATYAGASNIANVGFGGSLTDADITSKLRVTKYFKP